MQERIKSIIQQSILVKQDILQNNVLLETMDQVVHALVRAFNDGHRVYFCGNGGSAADAQHLAAEFSGRFYKDRPALPAEALHGNSSYITAVANDYGYDQIYARLISGIGRKGDVLVGLSTSGNSPNMVEACKAAKDREMVVIGFAGEKGGTMAAHCDHLIRVPSSDTPRIQESHIMIGHIVCELVEELCFP